MRTFKEHILEKLKVTKFSGSEIPTYQEYYDLLDEYFKTTHKTILDLFRIYDFKDDLLPQFEYDKTKVIGIITLRPSKDQEILLDTYNLKSSESYYHPINFRDFANKKVDFMSSEAVENTVKYMQEAIKK